MVFTDFFAGCTEAFLIQRPQCALIVFWPRVLAALGVLLVAFFVNRRVQRAIEQIVNRDGDQRELARLLGRAVRIGLIVVEAVLILSLFQATPIVATFVTSLGITGLILAFALQDITKNFAAGVLLLLLRPFRLDDRIKVRDFEGQVTDVSLRATALRTAEGLEVLVPNADVYASPITNLTRYPSRRYQIALTVPLGVPLEPTRQQITAILRAHPSIEHDPPAQVVATAISGDSVTLEARFWLPARAPDAAARISEVVEELRSIMEQLAANVESAEP